MRISTGRIVAAALIVVTATVVGAILSERKGLVFELALVGLFGLLLLEASAQLKTLAPGEDPLFDRPLAQRSWVPERPPDLVDLERTLGWQAYERRDFEHRVRPLLSRLVAARLQERRGIDPAERPEALAAISPRLADVLAETGDEPQLPERIDGALIDRLLDDVEAI
ncbi:MAG: hypothetical protein ABR529_05945 [Actinomycetota bacterium]